MIKRALLGLAAATLVSGAGFTPALAQGNSSGSDGTHQPPAHTKPFPNLAIGKSRDEARKSFEQSPHLERGIPAKAMLEQQRRLTRALDTLAPQRPGEVDAYVFTIALDSDPVFAREAREAARVLSRRYGGEGRTLVLAGPDGVRDDLPQGSIQSLLVGLARIAEVMDPDEDVLVLYTTSHGAKIGLVNHYGDTGYGIFSPARLQQALVDLGIERRLLIISACYSGIFVPKLSSDETVILTAASAQRTSFGCRAENDWTFFGDALINRALRKPQSLSDASKEANRQIAEWETGQRLLASLPQVSIGSKASTWLDQLEARVPSTASAPVGRPSVGE